MAKPVLQSELLSTTVESRNTQSNGSFLRAYAQYLIPFSLFTLFFLFATTSLELISMNNGLGGDGMTYARVAKDIWTEIGVLNDYKVQRVLPSILVWATLKILMVEATSANVIIAFQCLNLLCIIASMGLLIHLARLFHFSSAGVWLLISGTFVNFALLKMSSYNPVLTDVPTVMLATCMLYTYLRGKTLLLCICTCLSVFVWPTLPTAGLPLLLLGREIPVITEPRKLPFYFAVVTVVTFILAVCYRIYLYHYPYLAEAAVTTKLGGPYTIITSTNTGDFRLIYPAILGLCAYLYFAFVPLLRVGSGTIMSLIHQHKKLLVTAPLVLVVLFIMKIPGQVASSEGGVSMSVLLMRMINSSIGFPLVFLVAHVTYFGPLILLAVVFWKDVCTLVHCNGLGLTAFFVLTILLSLFSESRCSIAQWPFLAFFVAYAVDRNGMAKQFLVPVVVIGLFSSKIWMSLNSDISEYYFLNFGYCMPPFWYGVQFCLGVLMLSYFWVISRKGVLT